AQITWEEDDKKPRGCRDGKERNDDTDGHCCWPGQAWNGAACVGTPSSCPDGMVADGSQQACVYPGCAEGMVMLPEHKTCCWPGQAWSSAQQSCVGVPQCPENREVDGASCRYVPPDQDQDQLTDRDDK